MLLSLSQLVFICSRNNIRILSVVRMISTTSPNLEKKKHFLTASTNGRKLDIEGMEYQIGIPKRPQRPCNPWAAFVKDTSADMLKAHPGVSYYKLIPEVAKKWQTTDQTKYREEYIVKLAHYKKDLEQYRQQLDAAYLPFLELKERLATEHNAFKNLKKLHPLPKFVRNWANFFLIDVSKKPFFIQQLKRGRDKNQLIKEVFSKLSDEEREKYYKLYEKDLVRFRTELKEWHRRVSRDPFLRQAIKLQADFLFERYKRLGHT